MNFNSLATDIRSSAICSTYSSIAIDTSLIICDDLKQEATNTSDNICSQCSAQSCTVTASAVISYSSFFNNSASSAGICVFLRNQEEKAFLLTRCNVISNKEAKRSGIIYVEGAYLTITYSLFKNNGTPYFRTSKTINLINSSSDAYSVSGILETQSNTFIENDLLLMKSCREVFMEIKLKLTCRQQRDKREMLFLV